MRSSAITSRDAQLAICDLVFLLLIAKIPGANDAIHASEAAVSVLKS